MFVVTPASSSIARKDVMTATTFSKHSYHPTAIKKMSKSVASGIKGALVELFEALNMETISVEKDLKVNTRGFIKDFIKVIDEIKTEEDIVSIWHIDPVVAAKVFSLLKDVLSEPDELDLTVEQKDVPGEPDELDLSWETSDSSEDDFDVQDTDSNEF